MIQRNPDVGPAGIFDYEAYVVYPGGRVIPDRILAQATGLADGRTGAVLSQDPAGAGSARGFRGGWVIPTAVLNGLSPTSGQQGRLVSYVSMQKGLGAELQGKWLSRILTGDESDNRMEANINVGNHALNNVGWLGGQNLVSNPDSTLPRAGVDGQVSVDGNLVLDPSRQVGGQATRVEAPKLVSSRVDAGLGSGPKTGDPSLDVRNGKALLGDLSSDHLNADTLIYDGTGGRTFRAGGTGSAARLADLLPRFVMKASYVATDNTTVPKSHCTSNGDVTGARLYVIQDGGQAAVIPVITSVPSMQTQDVTVVTGVGSDGNGGIVVTTGTISLPTRVDVTNTSRVSPFRTYAYAVDSGSAWTVFIRTRVYNPDTGNYDLYDDEGRNRALVQVMCEYG